MKSVKISATIISFNEERKIGACIESLVGIADEIIVVDSFSTDRTKQVCERFEGVKFVTHPFKDYVDQKNYAVSLASHDYVLSLDADERLSEELKSAVRSVKGNWQGADGFIMTRYNNYCGKWMHFSGWYPERKIRLWDRRAGKWEGLGIHETVRIPSRKVRTIKGHLLHYAYMTVDEHLNQVHRFAEIAARAKYARGEKVNFVVNVIFSPLFRFIKNYFFQLGFLDGYYGFIFCAASASMTFFKYVRLYEYRRKGLPENQRKMQEKL